MVDAEQVRRLASGNWLAPPTGVPVSRTSPQLHLRVESRKSERMRKKEGGKRRNLRPAITVMVMKIWCTLSIKYPKITRNTTNFCWPNVRVCGYMQPCSVPGNSLNSPPCHTHASTTSWFGLSGRTSSGTNAGFVGGIKTVNSLGQMRIMNAAIHSVCHDYGQFVSASAARLVG